MLRAPSFYNFLDRWSILRSRNYSTKSHAFETSIQPRERGRLRSQGDITWSEREYNTESTSKFKSTDYFNAFFIFYRAMKSDFLSEKRIKDYARTSSISSRSLVSIRIIFLFSVFSISSICDQVRRSWTKFIEIPLRPKRPVRP